VEGAHAERVLCLVCSSINEQSMWCILHAC
jgi:hypothetical protein